MPQQQPSPPPPAPLLDEAASLKDDGNARFAAGDMAGAIERYGAALAALGPLSIADSTSLSTTGVSSSSSPSSSSAAAAVELRVVLFNNRATALMKLGDAAAAEKDCSEALKLDPGRAKALFRRAQAREALGESGEALRDLRRVLDLEPGNKAAAAAARRVKDKVASQAAENSPLRQALRALAAAAAAATSSATKNSGTASAAAAAAARRAGERGPEAPASEPRKEKDTSAEDAAGGGTAKHPKALPGALEALRALGAMASEDASAAAAVLREGGVANAMALALAGLGPAAKTQATSDSDVRAEALRMVSAVASHRLCGVPLLRAAATATSSSAAEDTANVGGDSGSGPIKLEDLTALVEGAGAGDNVAVATAALALLVHLTQWDDAVFVATDPPPMTAADVTAAAAAAAAVAAAAAAKREEKEKDDAGKAAESAIAAAAGDGDAKEEEKDGKMAAAAAALAAAKKKKKNSSTLRPPTPEMLEDGRYRRRWLLPYLPLVSAALAAGLRHADAAVRDTAMEALVRWCGGATAQLGSGSGGAGADAAADEAATQQPATSTVEQRKAAYRRKVRRSLLARDKALLACRGGSISAHEDSGMDVAAAAAATAALSLSAGKGGAIVLLELYKLLDKESASERRKAAAAIGRVMRAAAAAENSSDAQREADRDALQAALAPLLVFPAEFGGGGNTGAAATAGENTGKDSSPGGNDSATAAASSAAAAAAAAAAAHLSAAAVAAALQGESRLSGVIRKVALAAAVAASEPTVGAWALARPGCVAAAMTLAQTGDAVAHEAAAEMLCAAAGIEGGRPLLAPAIESGVLFALMESKSGAARAAAAAAYAKLGMLSRAMAAESDDVTKLLNVALDVLGDGSGNDNGSAAGENNNANTSERERAVEVLSFLVSKTRVKNELCYGSNRCAKTALPRLCRAALAAAEGSKGGGGGGNNSNGGKKDAVAAAAAVAAKKDKTSSSAVVKSKGSAAGNAGGGLGAVAYGLAFVLGAVAVSAEEEKKESFANHPDMTYEQYLQLQKLAESHGQGPKPDETDAADSHEAALRRCKALVDAGAVPALRAIGTLSRAGGNGAGSEAARLAVATCFRRIATEASVRGLLVQQGALAFLVNLAADNTASDRCRTEARHAVAKTLISVNPALLSDAQRLGAVVPLLALCRRPDSEGSDLERFEALLALTNLAGSGEAAQDRIAADGGVRAISYLQFSEHEMVRRAATECLGNLLPHPDVLKMLCSGDGMRLWVAFAGLTVGGNGDASVDDNSGEANPKVESEDALTAAAAAGGLAMAVQDEEVAAAFMAANGPNTLTELLTSGDTGLRHRAAVAVLNLTHQKGAKTAMAKAGVPAALAAAAAMGPEGSPAAAAVKSALAGFAGE